MLKIEIGDSLDRKIDLKKFVVRIQTLRIRLSDVQINVAVNGDLTF